MHATGRTKWKRFVSRHRIQTRSSSLGRCEKTTLPSNGKVAWRTNEPTPIPRKNLHDELVGNFEFGIRNHLSSNGTTSPNFTSASDGDFDRRPSTTVTTQPGGKTSSERTRLAFTCSVTPWRWLGCSLAGKCIGRYRAAISLAHPKTDAWWFTIHLNVRFNRQSATSGSSAMLHTFKFLKTNKMGSPMLVLSLKISIHAVDVARLDNDGVDDCCSLVLDQEFAWGTERPRQYWIKFVIQITPIKMERLIVRVPPKLSTSEKKWGAKIKTKIAFLPVRVIIHIDACRPTRLRLDATMRHKHAHHSAQDKWDLCWLDGLVRVLIPTAITKKACGHFAKRQTCPPHQNFFQFISPFLDLSIFAENVRCRQRGHLVRRLNNNFPPSWTNYNAKMNECI